MTHADATAGIAISEGSISEREADYLTSLVRDAGTIHIAQTGFGLGRSAWAFLEANERAFVKSFDLCAHNGTREAALVVADNFPERHLLVVGDSKATLPLWRSRLEDVTLAFIDGGHDYETARADLWNLQAPGRRVVIDDLVDASWAEGVVKAWREAIRAGLVIEEEVVRDGAHGWGVGRYV